MPQYDVREAFDIHVASERERVFHALVAVDLRSIRAARWMMYLRMVPSLVRSPLATWRTWSRPGGPLTLTSLGQGPFTLLGESPPEEILLGITGRFWRLVPEVIATDPAAFHAGPPPGMAQATWNFTLQASEFGTFLSTETRVRCADARCRAQFLRYWLVVGVGSGVIRRAILRRVRKVAESERT
jgi:hypothetical protein